MNLDALVRGVAMAALPAAAVAAWLLRASPADAPRAAGSAVGSGHASVGSVAEPSDVGSRAAEAELAGGRPRKKRKQQEASLPPLLARDLPVAGGVAWPARAPARSKPRGRIEIGRTGEDAAAPLLGEIETVPADSLPRWHVPELVARGIDRRSETEFRLTSDAVEAIFTKARDLLAGVAPEPIRLAGDATGLRLDGIREDSLLGRLGVVEGDVLLDLDGTRCATVRDATDWLERARRERRERLLAHVAREGEAFEIEIVVH